MRRLFLVLACFVVVHVSSLHAGRLVFLGKSVDTWRKGLANRDAAQRRSAAFALGRMGVEARETVPELARRVLDDSDAGVRDAAAAAIGHIVRDFKGGDTEQIWKKAGGTLVKALKEDADERVRRSAAYALGTFGPPGVGATEYLMKALKDNKPSVRQNAAWAIGQIGEGAKEAVGDLCELLSDKDTLVRRDAAGALGTMGKAGEAAGRPLIDLLKSESDDVVKKTALDSLAHIAGPEQAGAVGDLEPLLKDADPEVCMGAAIVFARVGGEAAKLALPALQKALKDSDPHTQELATAALSNLGAAAKPAMYDLGDVLTNGKNSLLVRRNAALAIAHIGADAAPVVPALVEGLQRSQPREVRQFSAEALAQMKYPANEKGVPAILESIEKDTDSLVRQKCVWSLFGIDSAEDFRRLGADKVLEKVLSERGNEMALVRYDAARKLANVFRADTPDAAIDVLLEMIKNMTLKVYNSTDANVEGAGTEASAGRANVKENTGGDARYMAAQAMRWLGEKAKKRDDVVAALRKAAMDSDQKLMEEATKSLDDLGLKPKN
jgi:HEAT repeat protein